MEVAETEVGNQVAADGRTATSSEALELEPREQKRYPVWTMHTLRVCLVSFSAIGSDIHQCNARIQACFAAQN